MEMRIEKDALGELGVPKEALWGIHTQRAVLNFRVSSSKTNPRLIRAMALVKKACALANEELGYLPSEKSDAIIAACEEIASSRHDGQFPVDALQGGAGTSFNMNINEVIANRALEILGHSPGDYEKLDPIRDVNLHQSTNDTYPTALRVAAIEALGDLSAAIEGLQGSFQSKEKQFASIVKSARTELQPAVPMTLGAEFSAFAEAFARDRWRVFKCTERVRMVNLGGTAVGTGLTAPRSYIFLVVAKLREITGYGLARAENGVDQTANSDNFVEIAGILKAHISNIIKICNDLRFMGLLQEIRTEPVQAGSSIMPGKVNPVILESAVQGALKARSDCDLVFETSSRSTFQINEFMPLLAEGLLEALDILARVSGMLAANVRTIEPGIEALNKHFDDNPMIITAFLPSLGYEKCERLLEEYSRSGGQESIKHFLISKLSKDTVEKALSPHKLVSLGFNDNEKNT